MKKNLLSAIVVISIGIAATSAKAQDKNGRFYSAGEIQSKKEVTYGRFEMLMYSSDVSGTTSTFFMWKDGSTSSKIRWNELDIETFGKSPSKWQSNPIWEINDSDNVKNLWEQVHSNIPIAKQWVKFTLEWTPKYIAWYNNDVEVRRILSSDTVPANHFRYKNSKSGSSPVKNIADPMRMCFNHWATFPSDWLGPFDPEKLPSFQFVDWVTYQPWNGNGFDPITIKYDFNSLEEVTSAFRISNHTFSENQCTFQPTNVGVINGYLWLSITGYNSSRLPAESEIPKAK